MTLKPERSLALKLMPSPEHQAAALEFETRWHLSQQLLAEQRGEEVLSDLLRLAPNRRARMLLDAQSADEKQHALLYEALGQRFGVDLRARGFADGYLNLVKAQATLSEKVFVFQILTESVSEAYCRWRLEAYSDDCVRRVDKIVADDEVRHLRMGHSLLELCDADERRARLNTERRRDLLQTMSGLCQTMIRDQFAAALGSDLDLPLASLGGRRATDLDYAVAKSMLRHGRI